MGKRVHKKDKRQKQKRVHKQGKRKKQRLMRECSASGNECMRSGSVCCRRTKLKCHQTKCPQGMDWHPVELAGVRKPPVPKAPEAGGFWPGPAGGPAGEAGDKTEGDETEGDKKTKEGDKTEG